VTAVDPRPPAGSASAHDEVQVARARRGAGATLRAYVALTKPRIIELLLVTTIPTMILAERGLPPIGLVVATLVGGTLAAASANTLNCYLDRDIDVLMHRTSGRPLVTGEVSPREALVFGGVLGVLSVVWMALLVNPVSAALTLAAIAFYVFVYTLGLKRRTPQNIVWGGAAGCMPVLIGWSAVTGTVGWAALILFGVVFLWTPPHYWPLSLRFKDDYAAAGVPMLPVVAAAQTVTKQIIVYSWAMVAVSLLLWPVAPTGWIYASTAVLAGGWFLYEAHAMGWRVRRGQPPKPMRLFHGSITYLTLLFVAVAVDPVILG
jgi:protoheme IX farnesyltransferase